VELILALALLIGALILFWQARRRQKSLGIPSGRIVYADTGRWTRLEEPLYDRETGLTGRPDYLVEDGEVIVPVEVKSSRAADGPYDGHIFQLAAYCLLVERAYGKRPPHGILHYSNRTFEIDYTPELETSLLEVLEAMRAQDRRKEVPRSHESPARCRGCGYREICEQKLEFPSS